MHCWTSISFWKDSWGNAEQAKSYKKILQFMACVSSCEIWVAMYSPQTLQKERHPYLGATGGRQGYGKSGLIVECRTGHHLHVNALIFTFLYPHSLVS